MDIFRNKRTMGIFNVYYILKVDNCVFTFIENIPFIKNLSKKKCVVISNYLKSMKINLNAILGYHIFLNKTYFK